MEPMIPPQDPASPGPAAPSQVTKAKLALPSHIEKISLRQLFWLKELNEHGTPKEISQHYENVSQSTLSRELHTLCKELHIPRARLMENNKLSEGPARVLEVLSPLLSVLQDFANGEVPKTVCLGSGGSLMAWLIGKRMNEIRDLCVACYGSTDIRLSCQPMRNREVLGSIRSKILDFGLIRTSLLNSLDAAAKSEIESLPVGSMRYGLLVPDRILTKLGCSKVKEEALPLEKEMEILTRKPIATVWPEGEFKLRLECALMEKDLQPRIELSYRSFPQVIPHMLQETHVGIVPYLPDFGVKIPGCSCYVLTLLKDYSRSVSLIWNKKPINFWINADKFAEILKFGPNGKRAME